MTTVQITLPDQLAEEALSAGLLSPAKIEPILREQLKRKAVDDLFTAMDAMADVPDFPAMSPEEVAEEIALMRAERRSQAPR
jgi:hypothetical protein